MPKSHCLRRFSTKGPAYKSASSRTIRPLSLSLSTSLLSNRLAFLLLSASCLPSCSVSTATISTCLAFLMTCHHLLRSFDSSFIHLAVTAAMTSPMIGTLRWAIEKNSLLAGRALTSLHLSTFGQRSSGRCVWGRSFIFSLFGQAYSLS